MAATPTMMPFSIDEKTNLLLQIVNPSAILRTRNWESFVRDLRIHTQDTVLARSRTLAFRSTDAKQNYGQLLKIFALYNGTRDHFHGSLIDFSKLNIPGRTMIEMKKAMKAIEVDTMFMDLPDPYPNTTPVIFKQFAKLPPEIRIMIWKWSCHSPRLLEVDYHGWGCRPLMHMLDRRSLAKVRPSAILHVNKESREIAKTFYEEVIPHDGCTFKSFYFNRRFDTVFFSGSESGEWEFGWPIEMWEDGPREPELKDYFKCDFLQRIRYLALPQWLWDTMNLCVAGVPNAVELSLVLGSLCRDEDWFPGERSIPPEFLVAELRDISDEELNETEKVSKKSALESVEDWRSGKPANQWRPTTFVPDYQVEDEEFPDFPGQDKLEIKFVTVVDEAGNQPVQVENE